MHVSSDAVAGFVGVVTGSVITGGTQWALSARADWRRARAARRLIAAELTGIIGSLVVLAAHRDHLLSDFPAAATPEFVKRRDTLAVGSRRIWHSVNNAYSSYFSLITMVNAIRGARESLTNPPDTEPAIALQIEATKASIDQALKVLGVPNAMDRAERVFGPIV